MNKSEQAIKLLAVVSDGLISSCKDCDGLELICHSSDYPHECSLEQQKHMTCEDCKWFKPCPTCQLWGELRKKLCYHEQDGVYEGLVGHCKHCGKEFMCLGVPDEELSPDLIVKMHGDIPLIVHWMKSLRIWEEFINWMKACRYEISCAMAPGGKDTELSGEIIDMFIKYEHEDILINGTLRLSAIVEYLKQREGR